MNNDIPFLGGEGYVPSNEPNKSNFIWIILAAIALVSFLAIICYLLIRVTNIKEYDKLLDVPKDGDRSDDNNLSTNSYFNNPWITPEGKVFDLEKFYRESRKLRNPPYRF